MMKNTGILNYMTVFIVWLALHKGL